MIFKPALLSLCTPQAQSRNRTRSYHKEKCKKFDFWFPKVPLFYVLRCKLNQSITRLHLLFGVAQHLFDQTIAWRAQDVFHLHRFQH